MGESDATRVTLRSRVVLAFCRAIADWFSSGNFCFNALQCTRIDVYKRQRLMLKENALDDKERIKALANELNMTPAELVKKIEKNAKSGFLYLARQVEASKARCV